MLGVSKKNEEKRKEEWFRQKKLTTTFKKPIIFLDIDGVLNSSEWYNSDKNPGNLNGNEGDIDPDCIKRLNNICKEASAEVVISSDWKINFSPTINRLVNAGFLGKVVGKTPTLNSIRGKEIEAFVIEHSINRYVIIDDRTDFLPSQKIHLVHVDHRIGLTDKDADKAIFILNF